VFQIIRSFFHPLRIWIPYVLDVIVVSDPEHIKRIEASGDVDRLHRYDTAALPWWVRRFFKATKFHDAERDLWFLPFEPGADPHYVPRRAYLQHNVSAGYTRQDVERIVHLLLVDAGEDDLAYEMVQVVNRRFFGEEIPRSITEEAKHTLQSFGQAIFPWRYVAARRAQQRIMSHCAQRLPRDVHILDVGHNIGEVVQTAARTLRTLKANVGKPVEEIFTSYAPTRQVPRIAVRSSKLGGLLAFPTRAGQTVIILKIAKAAAETKDLLFTFGTGRPERACVFMDFFLAFARDVQGALRETQSERSRP